MSDPVVISIVAGAISVVTTAITGWMAYMVANLNRKTDALKVVQDTTKSLVNHQAIATALLLRNAASRIAELTHDAGDIRVADDARKELDALIVAQAQVDQGDAIRKEAKP